MHSISTSHTFPHSLIQYPKDVASLWSYSMATHLEVHRTPEHLFKLFMSKDSFDQTGDEENLKQVVEFCSSNLLLDIWKPFFPLLLWPNHYIIALNSLLEYIFYVYEHYSSIHLSFIKPICLPITPYLWLIIVLVLSHYKFW